MIRWTTLQQELINDPLNLGYAEFVATYNEAKLLQLLNETQVLAPTSTMRSERGILDHYEDGAIAADAVLKKLEYFAKTAHPLASLVTRALKFLGQPEGIDFGSPTTQLMITRLGQGGVITQFEAEKLCKLGMVSVSRAEQLGLKIVTAEQLHSAIFDENGDRIIG